MVVAVCTRLISHSIPEHIVYYVHSCALGALCALCALKDIILSKVHRSACFVLMCTMCTMSTLCTMCTLCT